MSVFGALFGFWAAVMVFGVVYDTSKWAIRKILHLVVKGLKAFE